MLEPKNDNMEEFEVVSHLGPTKLYGFGAHVTMVTLAGELRVA